MRILILAGRGRTEDPWHDHAATSHRLATILADLPAAEVEVRSLFAGPYPELQLDLDSRDLLVLNIGGAQPGYLSAGLGSADAGFDSLTASIAAWARGGGAVLAVHQTLTAVEQEPWLLDVVGGTWIDGVSGHPPIGPMRLKLAVDHPAVGGVGHVDAYDERYCHLFPQPDVEVIGWTTDDDGVRHPVCWINTSHGGRTFYSPLGHDVRSFDSPSHQQLLRAAATWLVTLSAA